VFERDLVGARSLLRISRLITYEKKEKTNSSESGGATADVRSAELVS